MKATSLLCLVAICMITVDVGLYRVHQNPSTRLAHEPLRAFDGVRLIQKFVGLWITLGLIAALYLALPVYAGDFFQPFKDAALLLLPAVLLLSPFYIVFVDRRQEDPNDAYAQIGALMGGSRPRDWDQLAIHARGWLVKAFFTPLMFGYVVQNLGDIWSNPVLPILDFEHIFSRVLNLFYLLDVLLAAIAYVLTLRVIDNHIRSAEPTIGGWVVCLFCYPPFNDVTGRYFPYDQDDLFWGKVFSPYPWLYATWGCAILALVFIYAWSTAAFGLRFSNLTNRGIITNGPYRWSKHPAYISKNLSWWLISVPFVAGAGAAQALQSCLLLAAVNAIYFLRAKTEERHLSRDPHYQAYADYISRRGLWARLRRVAFGRL